MRKFEIASLLDDGTARTSHHLAPANELFEATSAAFAHGTLISTPLGPVAIEDLLPGDMVETVDGSPQPVIWISSTAYTPRQTHPSSTLDSLIRILADGYSDNGALGDLLIGPAARLLQSYPSLERTIGVKSVLTPARDLENGHHAIRITPPSHVRLFHLRLPSHNAIYASGRPAETYHPGRGVEETLGENVKTLFLSLFPDITCFADFGGLAYPRMSRATLDSLTNP